MLNIVASEFFKLSKRLSTYLIILFMILCVIGTAIIGKVVEKPVDEKGDWKQELVEKNKNLKKQNAKSQNSILIKNNNETILLNQYRLDHNIHPKHKLNAWSYTEENFPLLSVSGLLVIIIASGIVSSEFSWGTIKLVLIRPISRAQLLFSKLLTVLLFGFITITILFLASITVGLLFFGTGDSLIHLTINNGSVFEENILWYLSRHFLISTIDIWMMAALAFMLSTVLRNNAMALGISLFLYLMGTNFTNLLAGKFEWVKYVLFANTDLNMYTSGHVLIDGMTLGFSITVLAIYLAIFLGISFVAFTKRDIAV